MAGELSIPHYHGTRHIHFNGIGYFPDSVTHSQLPGDKGGKGKPGKLFAI
jgi:hypothetical protein